MPNTEPLPPHDLLVALPASAVDRVPVGVAKVDRNGRFTYANRKMQQIAAMDELRGRSLADIFRGEDFATVRAELRKRFEDREGNEYTADLTRPDGKITPVRITSFPETNEHDEVIGSLALVRDLTIEKTQQAMYGLAEQKSNNEELLDAIADTLRPLVPFDRMQVTRLNRDRTHLRSIYPKRLDAAAPRSYRWWHIPGVLKQLLDCSDTLVINDLETWYRDLSERHALKDKAIEAFVAEGFMSTMSVPVRQDGKQAASIVLSRKAGRPFTDEERDIADMLPLAEAVSVALRNENESHLNFMLDVVKKMSSAHDSVANVAKTIVDEIATHYDWDHVSIYQVDEQHRLIRLIAQHSKRSEMESGRTELPIGEGIVGHVFQCKKGVNIGDLDGSPEFSRIAIRHRKARTQSDLCIPIGSDARWLLNAEDKAANAFAPEEMHDLEQIADGLGALLKRTLEYHYRSAIVSRANDAIFLVNESGVVFETNRAASRLLRIAKSRIVDRPISEFFVDQAIANALLEGEGFPNDGVLMRTGDPAAASGQQHVHALLSVATLPSETPGKVFVASDMTQVDRARQLEVAQNFYREIAAQVKTPMSLAISWLRRQAARDGSGSDDLPQKAIAQLQKVELTLDRMMLTESEPGGGAHAKVLMLVSDLIASVLNDMPEREQKLIEKVDHAARTCIRGDAYELRYCLQTIFSYLVRLAGEDDRIDLELRAQADWVSIVVSGPARRPKSLDAIGDASRRGQVHTEISLGHATLTRLTERNGGIYEMSPAAERSTFSFMFPVAAEEQSP